MRASPETDDGEPANGPRGRLAGVSLRSGLLGCLALVLGFAHPGLGQQPEPITFQEAVARALDENTTLSRARNDHRVSEARTLRERMEFLPSVDFSSTVARTFGRSFSVEEGEILSETTDTFGADVSASLDLFDGFERLASLKRANLEEDASRLRLLRTRQDVVVQVVQGFTALLQDRQLAEVREEELRAQEDLLEQVDALVEVGRRPVSDLYQQRAARAEAELALIEARRQVELDELRLIQVLQVDPLVEWEFVAPPLPEAVPDTTAIEPMERLIQTAFDRRADVEAMEATVEARRQDVRAARSGYWPSLSVGGSYGSDWSDAARQIVPGTGTAARTVTLVPEEGGPFEFEVPGSDEDPEFFQPDFIDQLETRRGGSIRFSLDVPLFDRLQTRTSVEEAQIQHLGSRYDLLDLRQQVALQVRQAVLDRRAAVARFSAASERLEAASMAREAARRRYELGAATFVELAQAVAQYVSARSDRVRARYELLLAGKLIEYYTGGLDPEAALYGTGEAE